jgi:CotH kinase protein
MTRPVALALVCFISLFAFSAIAVADEAEPLFDAAAVAEIDFTLPPASLQKLEEEPETGDYQHAEITAKVGGATYSLGDVGLRLKGGHGSFRDLTGKAAFKVKFNEFVKGQKLLGLKKLTLNNMVQDPSMVHETMVYELFRGLGAPAPRTGYAFVRINDEPYGVYLNLETYDDVSLPRLFPSTQHLYEADAAGVDVRPGEAGTYEVDEGDDEDLSDLEALITAANDTVGDWSDDMGAVADLGEMTQMWAVERYAGDWDGYAGVAAPFRPNNYYLHSLDGGVFAMLPWGADQTWDVNMEFDEPAGGLLFNNCLEDVSCEALYEEGLLGVANEVPRLDFDQMAICTAELLAPWQAQEDPSRAEYDAAEIAVGVDEARGFIAKRPAELGSFLGAPLTAQPAVDFCWATEKKPFVQIRAQMPGPTEQSKRSLVAKLGSVLRKGKRLRVRVVSPGSGELVLSAKAKGHRVCGSDTAVGIGPATVSCRLTRSAVKALEGGPLRLGVRVRFSAVDGSSTSLFRRANLPRL